jgi:hypothetical protein
MQIINLARKNFSHKYYFFFRINISAWLCRENFKPIIMQIKITLNKHNINRY